VPLVACAPDHPPEAAQSVAFEVVQVSVEDEPIVINAGSAESVTLAFEGVGAMDCTVIPTALLTFTALEVSVALAVFVIVVPAVPEFTVAAIVRTAVELGAISPIVHAPVVLA